MDLQTIFLPKTGKTTTRVSALATTAAEPSTPTWLKTLMTALLKFTLLLCLAPHVITVVTMQQLLEQTYPFAPLPFACAGCGVMLLALLLGRLCHARQLWLVTMLMLGFAWMLTQARGSLGESVLPMLLYPVLLLSSINFIYRCRVIEPFLILLPLLICATIFLQLIYSPLLLLWLYQLDEPQAWQYAWPWALLLFSQSLLPCMLGCALLLFYLAGKHLYCSWFHWANLLVHRLSCHLPAVAPHPGSTLHQ